MTGVIIARLIFISRTPSKGAPNEDSRFNQTRGSASPSASGSGDSDLKARRIRAGKKCEILAK